MVDVNDWFYIITVETDTHIMLKEQGIQRNRHGGIIIIMNV